jgi:dTDP-4-amino-4,6-dideoxygalactose transaminase
MINVFEPKKQYISNKKLILRNIKKVLESGNYILGPQVKKLEKNFAKYCGAKYAIGVKNGTDALILALKSLDIKSGDEVITTSHTALATIAAIVSTGAKPVIVDIEDIYFTIDPTKLKSVINSKTKAIIPVHIYGQVCEMKEIISIAKRNKIKVIEDCSQALGTKYHKKKVGTFGDIGTFSFYPTKILGAIGDGGIIITNNGSIAKKLLKLRQYGWNKKRETKYPGLNSRLDELQAAILNVKIKNIDKDNQKRNKIASLYKKKIKNKDLLLPNVRKNSRHVFHIFAILTKKRKLLIEYLNKHKVTPGIHYSKPACLNNGYSELCKFQLKDIKKTIKISRETLSLPIYPELTNYDINKVIKLINKFK